VSGESPALERPVVSRDAVHVWRIDLDSESRPTDALWPLLGEEERARASRFVQAHHRRRFVVHRVAQRTILGRYLGVAPEHLDFVVGRYGKPALARGHASSDIRFSLSHSDRLALLAVACAREVGVDIERIRSNVDMLGIARRVFASEEAETLSSLPVEERPPAFFRYWCRLEARAKACGLGLGGGRVPAGPEEWSLWPLEVDAGFVAVLAVEGRDCRLSRLRYSPSAVPDGG
jgi:4'-phosphopantetheinyl transferase